MVEIPDSLNEQFLTHVYRTKMNDISQHNTHAAKNKDSYHTYHLILAQKNSHFHMGNCGDAVEFDWFWLRDAKSQGGCSSQ